MNVLKILYFIFRKMNRLSSRYVDYCVTYYKFKVFDVDFSSFNTKGVPILDINGGGKLSIGSEFKMNNGAYHNMIGRQQRCYFIVNNNGQLHIGNNVGISCTAIHCNQLIRIGDNVRIGGNTVIYDTDFHSFKFEDRTQHKENFTNVKRGDVIIENNSFIGAHCTILKGVTIGENAIVGACSVVTKSVPANEVWGGNPARFIKPIGNNQ